MEGQANNVNFSCFFHSRKYEQKHVYIQQNLSQGFFVPALIIIEPPPHQGNINCKRADKRLGKTRTKKQSKEEHVWLNNMGEPCWTHLRLPLAIKLDLFLRKKSQTATQMQPDKNIIYTPLCVHCVTTAVIQLLLLIPIRLPVVYMAPYALFNVKKK